MAIIEVLKNKAKEVREFSKRNKVPQKVGLALTLSLGLAACSPAIEQIVNPSQGLYLMPDLTKPDLGFNENQKIEYEKIKQGFLRADEQNKILFKNDDGKTFSKSNSLDILAKSTGVSPEQITDVTPDTFFYFRIGNLNFAVHKFNDADEKSYMMVFGSADQVNWSQALILQSSAENPIKIYPDGNTNITSGSRFVDPKQQQIGGFIIPTESQGQWSILFNPEIVGQNPTPIPPVPTAMITQGNGTVSNINLPANFDFFSLPSTEVPSTEIPPTASLPPPTPGIPTAIPPTEAPPTATSTSTPEATINLPIVLKYEVGKFDSLPSISQEDAVSPAFDAFLDQQEAAGNLNYFPDVRYLEGYGFGSDKWIPQRNPNTPASIVEIENMNYINGTFADNLRRPIVEQAYFKTQINNADYLLIISKFHNNDGSEVRIKIVVPKNKAEQYWEGYFNPTNMNKITLPKQWPDNADLNIAPLANDANYYLNYWKTHQTEMKALIDKMIHGNMQFPPEFANFLWEAQTMSTRPK